MKIILILIFALSLLAIAGEKYGVYDLQGNRVSTFEAEPHELQEKAMLAKAKEPNKNLYISSLSKGKGSKPISRYRYKAETGAYIETSRKETFSICPDKEVQGTWISEYSVALDEKNCLSIQASNLAGTFRVLFLQNSGLTDTIQVLVEQSYVPMGDYSHVAWVPDSMPSWCSSKAIVCNLPGFGHYENRTYSQPLIVDKTKLTIGDAVFYSELGGIRLQKIESYDRYTKKEKLGESKLPLVNIGGYETWRFANERSKKEGLDTVYRMIRESDYDAKGAGNFIVLDTFTILDSLSGWPRAIFVMDTSASGYREPFNEEWLFLMRAGASTRYYWGDEEDSLAVSRYAWVRPIELKPVAQLIPNKFGLYDMVGMGREWTIVHVYYSYNDIEKAFVEERDLHYDNGLSCSGFFDKRAVSPECDFIRRTRVLLTPSTNKPATSEPCFDGSGKVVKCPARRVRKAASSDTSALLSISYETSRLLRKTPKLHKLEKF